MYVIHYHCTQAKNKLLKSEMCICIAKIQSRKEAGKYYQGVDTVANSKKKYFSRDFQGIFCQISRAFRGFFGVTHTHCILHFNFNIVSVVGKPGYLPDSTCRVHTHL